MAPASLASTTPRPRGRPRKAWADLKPRSMRWRITQDPEQCAVLVVATAADEDCKEPKKRGRPRFPMKKLKANGLKTRKYRARLAARRELDALQPLLAVAAFEYAHEDAAAEEDAMRMPRALRMLLPDRGYVDERMAAAQAAAAAAAARDRQEELGRCPICLEDLIKECPATEWEPEAWGFTTCCGNYAHFRCARQCAQKAREETSPYVGDLASRGHDVLVGGCPVCREPKPYWYSGRGMLMLGLREIDR